MRILQLCCFTNHWNTVHEVESHDIKNNSDILTLPDNYGKDFDFIISAPPCRQFTIANTRNWEENPKMYVDIAKKCLKISEESGKPWIIENVIGRIDLLIPELKKYKIGIWKSVNSKKKHVIYSNILILLNQVDQRKLTGIHILTRKRELREAYEPDFIKHIENQIINL